MRYLPYVIGGFMLLPFFLWAGLWMAFPGPKPGITDAPMIAALIAVSMPLVLFHYIAALGYVANSMAGQPGETLPIWTPARWVQRAMAPLAALASVAAFAWLLQTGEGLGGALGVAAAGLFTAWIMAAARRPRRSAVLHVRPAQWIDAAMRLLGRLLLALPGLGWMLREAGRNPSRGVPLLAMNIALALGLLVWGFGFAVLVIPAMLAIPVVFYALFALTTE